MSEESTMTVQERRRIVRLLEKIHHLAEESSRRGMMKDGQSYLTQQYLAIVASLAARGHGLPDYFPPIGEDATPGVVGFASAQVAEYLLEEIEAEEAARGEGAASESGGSFFEKFFNSGEFQHIGEAMREAMPEWLRHSGKAPGGPNPSSEAGASSPRESRSPESATPGDMDINIDVDGVPDLDHRLAELGNRIREIGTRMRQPGVAPEELRRLAAELAGLGEEQARLAQEAAGKYSA